MNDRGCYHSQQARTTTNTPFFSSSEASYLY